MLCRPVVARVYSVGLHRRSRTGRASNRVQIALIRPTWSAASTQFGFSGPIQAVEEQVEREGELELVVAAGADDRGLVVADLQHHGGERGELAGHAVGVER